MASILVETVHFDQSQLEPIFEVSFRSNTIKFGLKILQVWDILAPARSLPILVS